jgi:hypothetical protein
MARPAESYRASRKARAKKIKIEWRYLPLIKIKLGKNVVVNRYKFVLPW